MLMIMQRIYPRLRDAFPTVVIRVQFVSTFVDCGYQSLVPNIGEDSRAEDDAKEFKPFGMCGLYTVGQKTI
jgi:hypothetical protein